MRGIQNYTSILNSVRFLEPAAGMISTNIEPRAEFITRTNRSHQQILAKATPSGDSTGEGAFLQRP